jgi:hypothetical protein
VGQLKKKANSVGALKKKANPVGQMKKKANPVGALKKAPVAPALCTTADSSLITHATSLSFMG